MDSVQTLAAEVAVAEGHGVALSFLPREVQETSLAVGKGFLLVSISAWPVAGRRVAARAMARSRLDEFGLLLNLIIG